MEKTTTKTTTKTATRSEQMRAQLKRKPRLPPRPTDPQIKWNATPEQFAKYQAREVELCRALRQREPGLGRWHTLFSEATWSAAQ